ncbi:S49 family peptidase [Neisseria sp. Ec49-e6-T10]|uniref:S49 family peptidase n=1 Tax=Neisseria sp. Ec49-e6-T10 TaxID=3140744 RepID=UPI003EBABE21
MSELDNQWEKEVIIKLLTDSQKEQRTARRWKIAFRFIYIGLLLLFLIVLPIVMSIGKISEMTSDHVAVVNLSGTIDSENDNASFLLAGMENAYKNPSVKAIILRANSPGGSPVISGIAYDEIIALKKKNSSIPVYVVVEDVCASGCYYIASAADKIYANQASLVGSIGVISGGFGFDKAIEKLGIERRLKTAGANKGMGDPFSPENPAQAEIWQELLNEIHQQFIAAVKNGRGAALKDKNDPDIFSGRVYTGSQGVKNGLVDGLGSVRSVARDTVKLPTVNYTLEPKGLAKYLGKGIRGEIKQSFDSLTQVGW